MSRKFLVSIDLAKNEIQNAAAGNLAAAPSSPVKGQFYYNTTDNILYWWNGTAWVSASGGSVSFGTVISETSFGQSTNNGSATTVSRSDHTHGTPVHDNTAHAAVNLSALAVPTADVNWGGFKITNLGAVVSGTDAVNKNYVDSVAQGLDAKQSVRVATTGNITLSGTQTIDGVAVVAGDRVLVKQQSTPSTQGIYVVAAGAWSRAPDADVATELNGAYTFVEEGTLNASTGWIISFPAGSVLGTTTVAVIQFSQAGTISGGAGLTKSAEVLNVGAGTGITVNPDDVAVNRTVVDTWYAPLVSGAKRYAANVAAATSTVINHALNTRDVVVDVYRVASPYDSVEADVERTDANNVTVKFTTAPAAGEYRVVVLA